MTLPAGFDQELNRAFRKRIHRQNAHQLDDQLRLQLAEAGHAQLGEDLSWMGDKLAEFDAAVKAKLCDAKNGTLKGRYSKLLGLATDKDSVTQVAAVLTPVVKAFVASINPAFAVAPLAVTISLKVLQVGLGHWCAEQPDGDG